MTLGRFVEKEKRQILRESKKRSFEAKQQDNSESFVSNNTLRSKPSRSGRSSIR